MSEKGWIDLFVPNSQEGHSKHNLQQALHQIPMKKILAAFVLVSSLLALPTYAALTAEQQSQLSAAATQGAEKLAVVAAQLASQSPESAAEIAKAAAEAIPSAASQIAATVASACDSKYAADIVIAVTQVPAVADKFDVAASVAAAQPDAITAIAIAMNLNEGDILIAIRQKNFTNALPWQPLEGVENTDVSNSSL